MAAVDFSNVYSATYSSVSFALFLFAADDVSFLSLRIVQNWANGID